MVNGFRQELHYLTALNFRDADLLNDERTSLDYLRGKSEQTDYLFEVYDSRERLSSLRLAQLARLLGSLGFYSEAIRVTETPHRSLKKNSFEESYLAVTRLFLLSIYQISEPIDLNLEIDETYKQLDLSEDLLRMRLTVGILGTIYNANKRQLQQVAWWREEAKRVLELILRSCEFSTFEKQLLTSRFYRASCYYPFLTDDRDLLVEEISLCEELARNLSPTSDFEKLIKYENIFPMCESVGRSWAALGEKEKALGYFREIVEQIDPYDSKAWVQYGDFLQNMGRDQEAREAFLNAACLGGPLTRIAWYRAGRSFERESAIPEALECYFNSIRAWISGISPLVRIYQIARARAKEDAYLLSWVEEQLLRLSASERLSEMQRREILEMLSNE